MNTGFPFACIEGSAISAARTAASAALAADLLHSSKQAHRVAVVGAGPIASTVLDFLLASSWEVGGFLVHDLVAEHADALRDRLRARDQAAESIADVQDTIRGAELVVFATTTAEPYLHDPNLFTP